MQASIKVSSTENGIIFGNIGQHTPTHTTHTHLTHTPHTHIHTSHAHTVYDIVGSTADRNCVVLNNIHIDIMDYIQPEKCTDAEFRRMWAEFEWENKIAVATNIGDLEAYLEHILQSTNMNCLTPKQVRTPATHTPATHTHTPATHRH